MAKKAVKKTAVKSKPAVKSTDKAAKSTTKTAKAADKSIKIVATPADTTDKAHLVSVVQSHTGSTATAAKEALDAVLETMAVTLKKNQKVQLLGFGTFEVAKRKARKGRNPATGEQIKIKASKTVRFRAGTKLKASV